MATELKTNLAKLKYPPNIIYGKSVYWYCLDCDKDFVVLQGEIVDDKISSYNVVQKIPSIIAIKVLNLIWQTLPAQCAITSYYGYQAPPLGSTVVLIEQLEANKEER